MNTQIYLDYAATTPMAPEAVATMAQCLTLDGEFANPASLQHGFGERANALGGLKSNGTKTYVSGYVKVYFSES